ncbi:MAG TPA: DegV family protein [Candidatus Borkfalkia excrementigallinarum]|uniref:DegV family protein n=1 Tax=Candidatus Borkfalkia excrementigallinarum TaxID=2838506 RepID=A0A9D2CQW7_9FIRM|nr:DegV family protein [Candidatus Borkfalkia excrementigallinarum]
MYQLFCDSNCELWHTEAKELGLNVIRMPYVLDGEEYYYDLGEKTDFKHFYDRMRAGAVPTTSAINEQNYIDYFEPVLKEGKDIYYITFSHKLSATFESMDRAIAALKEKYPDREIRTFDTKSISLGAGFQVRLAAKKYNAGATMDELDAYLTEIREHTVVYFVVDDLVYLKRGGRISSLTAAFGSLLGIKPMISVMPDGSLQSVGKVRGAKRVFSEFVRIMREHNCNVKDYNIEVLQADCPETGDMFVETLKQEFGGDIKVDYQVVGPVIAAHCGPGTLGLIFYGDK